MAAADHVVGPLEEGWAGQGGDGADGEEGHQRHLQGEQVLPAAVGGTKVRGAHTKAVRRWGG